MTENNFEMRNVTGEGIRLHQTGHLNNMREWQHEGLEGPYWRLYHHVRSGSAIRVNRRVIPLRPGEVVIIPESTPFDARGAAGVGHFWIHFSPPLQIALPSQVLRLPVGGALAKLLKEWRGLVLSPRDARGQRRLFHTCQAILHACLAQAPLRTLPLTPPALLGILEHIEHSLDNPPDNRALARRVGRSMEGFIRWFRAATGTSPGRYVTGRRIREAGRLLSLTDSSIEEIAEAVGFANRHHFTRVFTRHAGQSPAYFRSKQRRDKSH